MTISPFGRFGTAPAAQGLYDPAQEHDACGLAMVATLRGHAGHDIVEMALGALRNLEHRGAVGSDAGTGDGAGILTQIPHRFYAEVAGFKLPDSGSYGTGLVFLESADAAKDKKAFEDLAKQEGLSVLGWRIPPTNPKVLEIWPARRCRPLSRFSLVAQVAWTWSGNCSDSASAVSVR